MCVNVCVYVCACCYDYVFLFARLTHTYQLQSYAHTMSLNPTTRIPAAICPKCVVSKASGKTTCCLPGGAWFGNCGDGGDATKDHTWFEGVAACENGKLVATNEM